MGVRFSSSCRFKNVRVVHLNGQVEHFEHPVTVGQVTGNPAKHFVCTPAQLLSVGLKPLRPTTQLEPGHIYLMLPHSAFHARDVSPVDLASLVKKLTATAKTNSPCNSGQHVIGSGSPNNRVLEQERNAVAGYGVKRSPEGRSWKPVLDTIRESSFNRMSDESDVQEKNLEAD